MILKPNGNGTGCTLYDLTSFPHQTPSSPPLLPQGKGADCAN